jgi:hypothetical protein
VESHNLHQTCISPNPLLISHLPQPTFSPQTNIIRVSGRDRDKHQFEDGTTLHVSMVVERVLGGLRDKTLMTGIGYINRIILSHQSQLSAGNWGAMKSQDRACSLPDMCEI